MPAPGAGQLNRQITIQQNTQTKDAEGGMVDSWANFAENIWAKKNNLSGNERAATRQGGSTLDARTEFTIRYLAGITEQMRVLCDGKYYNIRHVNDFMDRHEFIVLTCDTGGNNGR